MDTKIRHRYSRALDASASFLSRCRLLAMNDKFRMAALQGKEGKACGVSLRRTTDVATTIVSIGLKPSRHHPVVIELTLVGTTAAIVHLR